ncbi:hypothetical protein HETIRDRAFT_456204 [Heterobasidion irregulare TC 32-1]|uniref:Ubiquitin 3 binding protein But2 C-terminal domain-containing protein n=1 Tax=Heterobasidion irregulare (strain TC 32-1) TaxID=747525 RepID=W4JMD7_HETIT|nr:uncharacterized protein HETIRDRAFT_456204 [Heterobasidion irregulare TC 32-1]ETW74629.1 hypothetical protein HETIRDRAFT_456204 [Heterobasidion irregulare TC 32-1]
MLSFLRSLTVPRTEYVSLAPTGEGDPGEDDALLSARSSSPHTLDAKRAASHPASTLGLKSYILIGLLASLLMLNVSLLPFTLSRAAVSEAALRRLPYPDQRLGLERAAKAMPRPKAYAYQWPDKIARLSQKLKHSVYGAGSQVKITVEDTTLMRFPLPEAGSDRCAIIWTPPPPLGVRKQDLTTKGDVTEIEVWSVIAPHGAAPSAGTGTASVDDMDWDALSWATRPVRGELLGTLDLTARPNATTVEFACPVPAPAHGHGGGGGPASLTVEMRCLRVACYVEFMQVPFFPKMGFELVRRQ